MTTLMSRLGRSDTVSGWALVSPAALLIGVFGLLPVLMSLQLSFQDSDLLSDRTPWVGFDNYRKLAEDPMFLESVKHTIVYTALFVPGTMLVGLLIAAAMNRSLRFISVYRTAAYVTMAVSTISQGIIFLWLTDRDYGLVNAGLNAVGLPSQPFLASPSQALFVIVAMTIWGWTGFSVIVYLAALQGVPAELHEAAAIDGASAATRFRTITVPLLGPANLFLVVWLTINALQLFDEVYATTRGGPLRATTVIVYYLWDRAFVQFDAGYAAAMAYALFVVILVITGIQFRLARRHVHYS
ncbi:carbohydrate ABC transporter permease [Mycolicibacterium tokaiense]|uniref:Sugar ABC transporter integral membrane protein n=1 Tax=Mycolicibacterium tokaiense TaxID=39695 RepID=A0A378TML0_9MYCO|nr:sugar ABC transporter permease [Mycolicibacterium tokaiense]BBY89580.1 sugar transporter [Mycolicibacterium tokaiense]STZ62032.1 sugar ABC transporter integral membrane protein [Mycolicibacterium tokaiense]